MKSELVRSEAPGTRSKPLGQGPHAVPLRGLALPAPGFSALRCPRPFRVTFDVTVCVWVPNTLQALIMEICETALLSLTSSPFLSQTTNKIARLPSAAGPPRLSKGPPAPPGGPSCSAPLGSFKDVSMSGLVETSTKARPRRDH